MDEGDPGGESDAEGPTFVLGELAAARERENTRRFAIEKWLI